MIEASTIVQCCGSTIIYWVLLHPRKVDDVSFHPSIFVHKHKQAQKWHSKFISAFYIHYGYYCRCIKYWIFIQIAHRLLEDAIRDAIVRVDDAQNLEYKWKRWKGKRKGRGVVCQLSLVQRYTMPGIWICALRIRDRVVYPLDHNGAKRTRGCYCDHLHLHDKLCHCSCIILISR